MYLKKEMSIVFLAKEGEYKCIRLASFLKLQV